jgi:hypothetical protein
MNKEILIPKQPPLKNKITFILSKTTNIEIFGEED